MCSPQFPAHNLHIINAEQMKKVKTNYGRRHNRLTHREMSPLLLIELIGENVFGSPPLHPRIRAHRLWSPAVRSTDRGTSTEEVLAQMSLQVVREQTETQCTLWRGGQVWTTEFQKAKSNLFNSFSPACWWDKSVVLLWRSVGGGVQVSPQDNMPPSILCSLFSYNFFFFF